MLDGIIDLKPICHLEGFLEGLPGFFMVPRSQQGNSSV
jgi:hypothetical protein